MPTTRKQPAEPGIGATVLIAGDPQLAVGLAGLLASEPELRDAELSEGEWRRKLVDYLKSPRP